MPRNKNQKHPKKQKNPKKQKHLKFRPGRMYRYFFVAESNSTEFHLQDLMKQLCIYFLWWIGNAALVYWLDVNVFDIQLNGLDTDFALVIEGKQVSANENDDKPYDARAAILSRPGFPVHEFSGSQAGSQYAEIGGILRKIREQSAQISGGCWE